MGPYQGLLSSGDRAPVAPDDPQVVRALAIQIAAQLTIRRAAELLASELARVLSAPVALLSGDRLGWRFEAHAFPSSVGGEAVKKNIERCGTTEEAVGQLEGDSGHAWTAIALKGIADRQWTLLLPGDSAGWSERSGFDQIVEAIRWSLSQVATREREDFASRLQRRLHAFNRRLAREQDTGRLNKLTLRTVASQVNARTGSLAVFDEAEDALVIAETLGYPLSTVEHLRIRPGDGLLGGVYQSGKPVAGNAGSPGVRRLRYRTDSYLIVPMLAGTEHLAVLALTDRADGCAFDAADLSSARLLVSAAASAFSRQRLRTRLAQVTELATVDPVTTLFNRRYFETRLDAEVERARRQGHDLALLLIDIDDFKHVNDTRGHLEGDRTLREVADLLRAGIRIFDVCARFGGEEFVIVMPAASVTVAQQVAERIRARVERSFSRDAPPITVSVGVAMLRTNANGEDLIDSADRALIAAKRAGKNLVLTDEPPGSAGPD
jgi:diguanylate cyclase (GGDEF)-like protein